MTDTPYVAADIASNVGWELVPGVLGEKVETFDDKYPDCLPKTTFDWDNAADSKD